MGCGSQAEGEIIVAESLNNCTILHLQSNRRESLIINFGSHGSGPEQFRTPRGITVNDKKNIPVVDVGGACMFGSIDIFSSEVLNFLVNSIIYRFAYWIC